VIGGLAVAWCRGRRRRASRRLVRFAGEVMRLPVTMLTERAAVASSVTTAARLVRLPTAVPTVLNKHNERLSFIVVSLSLLKTAN